MISQVIGKGMVQLTQKDLNDTLTLVPHELPNADMYESICQFKMIGMNGEWLLFNVIQVDNEDEVEKGINIFVNRVEIVESYEKTNS
jgi:hypothetical protein